jgi:hypothetical protein
VRHLYSGLTDIILYRETEKSLKRRNESLREELKQLSVQLTDLLSKQRPVRPVHTPNLSMSISSHHGVNSGKDFKGREYRKSIRGDEIANAARNCAETVVKLSEGT